MSGPHPAVALTRLAVRHALRCAQPKAVVVGVSGGADSLALAAAVRFEAPKQDIDARVVIVDHGMQPGSRDVADRVARSCFDALGYAADRVQVVPVDVAASSAGPEAAARAARHRALTEVAREQGASIMLGHTGDDQAEQVFLALVRGSGTRALAGMRAHRDRLIRPFLLGPDVVRGGPVMRQHTEAACAALGLEAWQDPMNADHAYTRVRAREAVRRLETEYHLAGLRRGLVRTADSAARDADLLDRLTDEALTQLAGSSDETRWPTNWPVDELASLDPALRIRALRRLLVRHGARDGELGSTHLLEVESLVTGWRGQGPIDVPGGVEVVRRGGEVVIRPRRDGQ